MFYLKTKKYFQNLIKLIIQKIFKFIYGSIYYSDELKLKNFIKIFEIKNKKIKTFFDKTYEVYQISNGRIYNDNVQNVAIISKNQIINGPSYQQIDGELKTVNFNICLKIGTPRLKKKIDGRVLNLAQGASGHNNYSHWLLDMLPKFRLYKEFFKFEDLEYIYLNKVKDYQKSSLNLLGLQNVKLIDSDKFRHLECKELIATHHPSYFQGYILDQAQFVPKWIIEWIRDTFLDKSDEINSNGKIFIDRSGSSFNHCQIINHSEVKDFLKKKDFEIIKTENLSFKQQINLFKKAKIIVSAHGAGLANLSFCEKNCNVIEIRPSKPGYGYQNKVYERISEINNLNYKLYSTEYIEDKDKNGDILINTKILNNYLKGI
tara:strand:+ start:1275 stop:2399 length:1125 start_codon:yes stop_codon:yes gene_type:complete